MAIYKDPRILKKISLPSIEGSEVEIWNTMLWGDLEQAYGIEGDIAKGKKALTFLIKDWNLTDESENKLPINEATLDTFTLEMISHLLSMTDFGKNKEELLKKK